MSLPRHRKVGNEASVWWSSSRPESKSYEGGEGRRPALRTDSERWCESVVCLDQPGGRAENSDPILDLNAVHGC